VDPRLLADVKAGEGCKLVAYKDTLGFWTIGYGHLLFPQSKDWSGYTESQDNADQDLVQDLIHAQANAMLLPEWASLDTPCRQNAVTELVFNMGLSHWKGFIKCRTDIQNQNWQCAHDELLNSLWAKQVGQQRSNRLADYLLNGQYN